MRSKNYRTLITLAERVHRRTLDLVQIELKRLRLDDLKAVQAMILLNLGTDVLSVGELELRGCYHGNLSYNLKAMAGGGYIVLERSTADRRITEVRLSERGHEVVEELEAFFEDLTNTAARGGLHNETLTSCAKQLLAVEQFSARAFLY